MNSIGVGVVILYMIGIGGLGMFYLGPSVFAYKLRLKETPILFLINLLLGWTVIGWFGVIFWSVHSFNNKKKLICIKRSSMR